MSGRAADVRRGYVGAGGVRLSYMEAGEGPPLILLHGFPQTWYCWRHLVSGLAESHRVIAFDLKGYGESDKPAEGYDLGTLTREMRDALHAMGYGRAVWAGHDWGGVIAWAMALRYPETVERLVTINAPLHRLSPLHSWYVLPFSIPGLMEAVLSRFNDRFIRLLRSSAYVRSAFPDDALEEYARAFALPGVHSTSLAYYRNLWKSGPQLLLWRRRKVRCPCLIIWGLHDSALPVSVLKGMEKYLAEPYSIHPVPQCGHWVMEEQPEVTMALMREFINQEAR